jgi:DNA-binding response OmpR family regulator
LVPEAGFQFSSLESSQPPPAKGNLPANQSAPSPSAAKPRLLLVEDDAASRNALRYLMLRRGFEVDAVVTVAEALHSLSATAPQIIILDLMLPDGSGLEVLRAARAGGEKIKVAVVTGVNDPAQLRQVDDLKPDCILHKPLDLALLLKIIG